MSKYQNTNFNTNKSTVRFNQIEVFKVSKSEQLQKNINDLCNLPRLFKSFLIHYDMVEEFELFYNNKEYCSYTLNFDLPKKEFCNPDEYNTVMDYTKRIGIVLNAGDNNKFSRIVKKVCEERQIDHGNLFSKYKVVYPNEIIREVLLKEICKPV